MPLQRIAQFEKVSYEQFKDDYFKCILPEFTLFMSDALEETIEIDIHNFYNKIKLPVRATSGSAGYDFFTPIGFKLKPQKSVTIPTGVRVKIDDGWVLQCFPRSGLGSRYRLQLDNTVGIIDSDYYYSDNEGHIFAKITNDSKESDNEFDLTIETGQAFMQGVFVQYGITEDDNVTTIRNGGFGSTDKKN